MHSGESLLIPVCGKSAKQTGPYYLNLFYFNTFAKSGEIEGAQKHYSEKRMGVITKIHWFKAVEKEV